MELSFFREKNFKRDNKIIPILQFIHNQIWKMMFNKGADGLEKSVDEVDEYRIVENSPICNKYITLPKGNSVNCAAYFGGIIEGILNSADFRCKVNACFSDTKTYYIIKFDHDVITRDNEIK